MGEKKQARLVKRGRNELNGGTYEILRSEDGKRWGIVINMDLVETVKAVEVDD